MEKNNYDASVVQDGDDNWISLREALEDVVEKVRYEVYKDKTTEDDRDHDQMNLFDEA